MSTEIVTSEDATTVGPVGMEQVPAQTATWLNETEVTSVEAALGEFPITQNVNNTAMGDKQQFPSESELTSSLFEAFIIIEIVMTAMELILTISAASKIARWRRNYRNQMLMQLSLVRFLKRVYSLIEYLREDKTIPNTEQLNNALISVQIYIDFVIVILVCFFIIHMYNSLFVVLVKVNKNQLVKMIACAWLIPLPISVAGTAAVITEALTYWWVYLFICAVFRWPLIFIGTLVYFTILVKVLIDQIRRFARSLTIITFLLCLVINVHLFLKDVIFLWSVDSVPAVLVSYLLGFILNVLILCLYIILIIFSWKYQKHIKSCGSLPNCSEHITKF